MNNTPALQPMAATRDDRDAAARRRDTAGYRMSQAGLIEAGVDAASEDSADEYSSPSGDTFSDMILKLLKQMTGGGDVVDIGYLTAWRETHEESYRQTWQHHANSAE